MNCNRAISLSLLALLLSPAHAALPRSPRSRPAAAKASPAPAAEQTPPSAPAMSEAEVAVLVEKILAARSYPEAYPSLDPLSRVPKAFVRLEKLVDDPKLHPEVRFYVIKTLLGMESPAAVSLAARYVSNPDRDLRFSALRILMAQGDARFTDALMDAALNEKDDSLLPDMLWALGRTDPAKAVPFLEGYLRKDSTAGVLNGAAAGLGQLHSAASAVKFMPLLSDQLPDWTVTETLGRVHEMLGKPGPAELVRRARDADDPMRLYAVNQLHDALESPEPKGQREELAEAAASAFGDPRPVVRWRALRSFSGLLETRCGYIPDRKAVARILDLVKDPNARVRYATIEALHNTALRRGLVAPMVQPVSLDPETMRMLRWPADWLIFPRFIELLDDPDPAVREKAIWTLGISTGYWYGYDDIRLLGKAQITPDAKAGYQAMWNEMKDRSAAEATVAKLDEVVRAMVRGERPSLHGQWMRGVKILTSQSFGWKASATPEEKKKAIADLEAWWQTNRTRHPAEWIVDSIKDYTFKYVDETNFHVLGRWGSVRMDEEVFNPMLRRNNPDEVLRRLQQWWDTIKPELALSSSPSR